MDYHPVHILSLCSIVVSAVYAVSRRLHSAIHPRERLNQIFALICLSLFFWSFAYTFLPGAASKEQAWIWFKLSAVGWTLLPSLLLHFCILLSENGRWLRRRWVLPAIYLPGALFLGQAVFGRMGVIDFVWTPFGWSDVYQPLTASYAAYLVFFPASILLGLSMVWVWGRRSSLLAHKRQAQLIVITGVPVLNAVAVSGIFLPWMGVRVPPEVAHLIALIWILAIWYSVSAHRLMMTPAAVAADILRTLADAVLLLSRDQRIITINDAAEDLLGHSREEMKGRAVHTLFQMEDETEAGTVRRF